MCFTRDSLAELLASTEPQSEQSTANADILAGVVFGALGRRCYFHLPSLCLHAGDGISTLGHEHGWQTLAVGFQAEGGTYRPASPAEAEIAPCDAQPGNGATAPAACRPGREVTDFSDTTVCVTVLFRFDRLQALLCSIRRFYPQIEIIVADNSFRPEDWGNHEFLALREILVSYAARPVMLPLDSGVSATRNAAVTAARTPYVIICEEDFEFSPRTDLEKLLRRSAPARRTWSADWSTTPIPPTAGSAFASRPTCRQWCNTRHTWSSPVPGRGGNYCSSPSTIAT